jgi:hypothetical protein
VACGPARSNQMSKDSADKLSDESRAIMPHVVKRKSALPGKKFVRRRLEWFTSPTARQRWRFGAYIRRASGQLPRRTRMAHPCAVVVVARTDRRPLALILAPSACRPEQYRRQRRHAQFVSDDHGVLSGPAIYGIACTSARAAARLDARCAPVLAPWPWPVIGLRHGERALSPPRAVPRCGAAATASVRRLIQSSELKILEA